MSKPLLLGMNNPTDAGSGDVTTVHIDYKLVYKVRGAGVSTEDLGNLQTRFRREADERANSIHKTYTDLLTQHLGHSDFEVTNIACMADGILGHVYVRKPEHQGSRMKGAGHRVCVFCGLDDFDF